MVAASEVALAETLPRALEAVFDKAARRVLIDAADGRYTGADLASGAARYAGALAAVGVGKGDRVAVQVDKSVESIFLYLACLRLGAAYLPLNTAYRPGEVAYFLEDATPRLFVCEAARAAEAMPLIAGTGARLLTIGEGGGDLSLPDRALEAEPAAIAPLLADDLAAILYTSGTTGRSKGAMITHRNLLSNALALVAAWRFSQDDILLHALPIFHIHGLFIALNTALLSGASVIFHPRFDAAAVVRDLPKATVFMGVPTYYTRLLDRPDLDQSAVSNLRLCTSGSAPLSAETFEAFAKRTGHRILERYGMTETGVLTANPFDGPRLPGTVGLPVDGVELRIANDQGEKQPEGAIGVVEAKGPGIFGGYWRQPEKTKAEFRRDGFFVTGDVGQIEPNGYLRLIGRAKDLIICGGLNVYPKEIEALIDAFEGVRESAVVGLPHPDFGEAVVAVIEVWPETNVEPGEIIVHLKASIANFKVPKAVFLLEELPRNALGKVQKNLLRERYRTTFESAAPRTGAH